MFQFIVERWAIVENIIESVIWSLRNVWAILDLFEPNWNISNSLKHTLFYQI